MSASNIITATVDLARGVQLHRLGRLFASGDKAAHTFVITVLNDGAAADLSGSTISAYFIRPDEATVTVSGTLSGNVASVTLPADCYIKTGHFQLIVKAISSNVNAAIFFADGTVTRSTTDIIVDPSNIVPSLEELLAQLDAMVQGTAAANAAAATANSAAETATAAAGVANTAADAADTATVNAEAAAISAEAAAQQVTDAIIPDLSDVTCTTLLPGTNATFSIDTTDEGTLRNPKVTVGIPRGADGSGAVSSVDGIQPVSGNVTLPVMQPPTSSEPGAAGKVPAPPVGSEDKYLAGDGTWKAVLQTIPTASASTKGVIRIGSGLEMSGEVLSVPVMAGLVEDWPAAGLVPAPGFNDFGKFLSSSGSWESPGAIFTENIVEYLSFAISSSNWETLDVWEEDEYGENSLPYRRILQHNAYFMGGHFIMVGSMGAAHKDIVAKTYDNSRNIAFCTTEIPGGTVTIYGILVNV